MYADLFGALILANTAATAPVPARAIELQFPPVSPINRPISNKQPNITIAIPSTTPPGATVSCLSPGNIPLRAPQASPQMDNSPSPSPLPIYQNHDPYSPTFLTFMRMRN